MNFRLRQSYPIKNKSTHCEYLKGRCFHKTTNKESNFNVIKAKGFTLIEFIVAMVLLGILAVGISSFLQFGSQMYSDASARDQILSSARFAIERLNRELRGALPNSARITTNECLEFMPIQSSAIYVDIPVSPDAASDEVTIVPASTTVSITDVITYNAIVYPTSSDDVYLESNNKFYPIDSAIYSADEDNDPHRLFLEADVLFADESTTSRVYFVDDSVMYCIEGSDDDNSLIRYDVTSHNIITGDPEGLSNRAVMAEYLKDDSAFSTIGANLQRNSIVSIRLYFTRQYEEILFENEVQVPNVP
jgi:MSHA biogenesis protein MshO